MNELINTFLLTGDNFMPEMHQDETSWIEKKNTNI